MRLGETHLVITTAIIQALSLSLSFSSLTSSLSPNCAHYRKTPRLSSVPPHLPLQFKNPLKPGKTPQKLQDQLPAFDQNETPETSPHNLKSSSRTSHIRSTSPTAASPTQPNCSLLFLFTTQATADRSHRFARQPNCSFRETASQHGRREAVDRSSDNPTLRPRQAGVRKG